MHPVLIKKLASKSIVWFKNTNSYLLFEHITAQLIKKLTSQLPIDEIVTWCANTLTIPLETAHIFTNDVQQLITSQLTQQPVTITENDLIEFKKVPPPQTCYISKKYSSNQVCVLIDFESEYVFDLIHPKFAHLEIDSDTEARVYYQFFTVQNEIIFYKNGQFIGNWKKNAAHFFQGKVSMHLVMDIYNKPEKDWLGVFHASAITNKRENILLLGDSGSGKSTSLALLAAHGFTCTADDFVPIDNTGNVYTFPAAISIKKNSVETLVPYYPELANTSEIEIQTTQKIVRFLAPKKMNDHQKLPCKALVFIKYQENSELQLQSLSKIEAFQQLVPDSWISPLPENAARFLDWFAELPCYELNYSNNQKMMAAVTKIFENDL